MNSAALGGQGSVRRHECPPRDLNPGQQATVDVSFTVSEPGAGLISLVAFSPETIAHDTGSYRVVVTR